MGDVPAIDPTSTRKDAQALQVPTDRLMNPPLVSILIPSYEAAAFLKRTIDSVYEQTLQSWELVIVDDASSDSSWDIACDYRSDPRIRLVRHADNLGAPETWNHALSLARGRYVKLLCSDDLIYPECLERQVSILDSDQAEEIGLVTSKRDIIDASGSVLLRGRGLSSMRGRIDGRRAMIRTAQSGANLIGEPSIVLFRRPLLVASGGFNGSWRYVIDIATYARVLKRSDLYAIGDTLGAFRVGSHSWSATLAASQGHEFRRMIRAFAVDTELGFSRPRSIAAQARATAVATARVMVLRAAAHRARLRMRMAS